MAFKYLGAKYFISRVK